MPTLIPKWNKMNILNMPPPRIGSALIYNPTEEVAYLFGGFNSSLGCLNDSWSFNGTHWQQCQTSVRPTARYKMTMAWNNELHQAFLFGGVRNGVLLGDTWSFNGVNWAQHINSPQALHPRVGASMAYDPDRNLVVLFGGRGDTGGKDWEALNDMWVWDGTDWERQFPANLPPARFGANLVYDTARQSMLLFGGGIGGGLLDDTWIWDGTNWIIQRSVHHPPARANFGMTYDESRQMIILYGGQLQAFADPTETWAWDGDDWVLLPTIQNPPSQLSYLANLVYLSQFQTVVLFNDFREKIEQSDGTILFTERSEIWNLVYITD